MLANHSQLNPEAAHTIGILRAIGRVLINRVIDERRFTRNWDGHQPIQEWERSAVGFAITPRPAPCSWNTGACRMSAMDEMQPANG